MKIKLSIILCLSTLFPIFTAFAQENNYERLFYMAPGKNGLESFRTNAKNIDIIAPQNYTVDSSLNIKGSISSEIKKIAKENNIKIMPLIVNASFNQKTMHSILIASSRKQDELIEFLISEAIINNYAGWQFDFEHIHYTDRDKYSEFIERTYKAFKNKNLVLSIAAVVSTKDTSIDSDMYKNWSGAFDYKRLAESTDFISLMTYDDPASFGPVASMPFIENVYEYMKDKIPPRKMSLGIPLYYWGWKENPYVKIRKGGTYDRLSYIRRTFKTTEGFHDLFKVPFLKYSFGKDKYIIWHEDKQSITYKIDFLKSHELRGLSAWVLGLENPGIWEAVSNNKLTKNKI